MFDDFRFVAWTCQRVNLVPHKGLVDLIITRPRGFLLIFAFESDGGRFEDWIGSGNLKNFDVLSFARYYDFLSVGFEVYVVGTYSRRLIFMLTKSPEFWLHTSEGHKGFGKFTLFLGKGFISSRTRIGFFSSVGFTLTSKYESHLY